MHIAHSLDPLRTVTRPVVLAAGVFDGVHRGHRAVLDTALQDASQRAGEAWVLTFDPHPQRVVHPASAPPLLTSTAHKLLLLADAGLSGCIVHPFTMGLAALEPEAFVDQLSASVPRLAALVVGYNWTFGRRARGNVDLLRDLARVRSIAVHIVKGLQWEGDAISSTRIRQAVMAGALDQASAMLGRPFSVQGEVKHGKQLGRQLGFPTANVRPTNDVRPPPGSYAVRVRHGQTWYGGAGYVGNPDRGLRLDVEVHLLDQSLDLYGAELEVFFHQQVRPDAAFTDLEALKTQIARDVAVTRRVLKSLPA